jgi:hypothetical protein
MGPLPAYLHLALQHTDANDKRHGRRQWYKITKFEDDDGKEALVLTNGNKVWALHELFDRLLPVDSSRRKTKYQLRPQNRGAYSATFYQHAITTVGQVSFK